MSRIYLMELDGMVIDGKPYTVGEPVEIADESGFREWLKTAKKVRKEYTIYPFLFGLFGGVVKKIEREVWVQADCLTCLDEKVVTQNAGYCGGCERCGSTEEKEVPCPDCSL